VSHELKSFAATAAAAVLLGTGFTQAQ